MSLEPVTQRSNRKTVPNNSASSPEEKQEAQKQGIIERLIGKEKRKKEAIEKKAEKIRLKAEKSAESKRKKAMDKAKKKVRKALSEAKRESTKNKALDVYRLELASIKNEHDLSIDAAKAAYNKTVADAQAVLNSAISDIMSGHQ